MTTPDPHRPAEAASTAALSALHVLDRSVRGLGGVSAGRLPENARVTLFVPADRNTPSGRLTGRVVRCRPSRGGGFDVGIALESDGSAA